MPEWRRLALYSRNILICNVFHLVLYVIERHEDFVVLQRPWAYGYRTEYVCWFVNRERMLSAVQGTGFRFVREFLVDERPIVPGAPEQCRYGGFLFQRSD